MGLKNTRAGNYPEWYQNVVSEADMAENSSSPGCMVIKPWGYASAMFLMKKSKKPNMKTAISQCLFRCLSFKKKPSMLTDLPKKWLLSPIPACQ